MGFALRRVRTIGIASALLLSMISFSNAAERPNAMENPVAYFEIAVTDLDRATKFYAAVFGFTFERDSVDGIELAWLPYDASKPGASGALAKGEIYAPTKNGAVIYFSTADIDATLTRITALGRPILYPKTDTGYGYVAEFEDSEGNRIALLQRKKP